MDKLKTGAAALGLNLSREQLDSFNMYYRELIDWNKKVNLTAITDPEDVQVKHFLDSLTAAAVYDFNAKPFVLDVGTGAGFPGLPLKIVFPGIRLTLLEATVKKTTFLDHMVKTLGLPDVEIVSRRAEELAHNLEYREKFDVVLSRAVASLPALVELGLPFCKIGGTFIVYKKGDITVEVKQSAKAVGLMGGTLKAITPVNPDLFDDNRSLVIVEKMSPTPPQYPRRPGMPEKRPLLN